LLRQLAREQRHGWRDAPAELHKAAVGWGRLPDRFKPVKKYSAFSFQYSVLKMLIGC